MWTNRTSLAYLSPDLANDGPPELAVYGSTVQPVEPQPQTQPQAMPAVVIPTPTPVAASLPAASTPQNYNTPTPPAASTVAVPTTTSNAGFLPASIMQTANNATNAINAVNGGTAVATPVSTGLDPLTLIAIAAAGYYFLIYKKGGR